jgi:hypothetical protein
MTPAEIEAAIQAFAALEPEAQKGIAALDPSTPQEKEGARGECDSAGQKIEKNLLTGSQREA